MKNFSFDGRLGKDAEVKTTKGGKPYVRFSVANNSFSGGTESTEWIDVTSYDQFVVENRAKYLTKGTYVIVNGDVRFEVSAKENKIWKNIYVTANSIDTPNFGKKDDAIDGQTSEATASPSTKEQDEPVVTTNVPTYTAHIEAPVMAPSAVGEDDLPF